MRDQRFIASHRGGPLDRERHQLLALWAADCAEHVLSYFAEQSSSDERPARAIAAARSWARGEIRVGEARKAALAAHAAAREVTDNSALAAARAAGHAAATVHMADHCLETARYANKANLAAGESTAAGRAWQIAQLPEPVRELVTSTLFTT